MDEAPEINWSAAAAAAFERALDERAAVSAGPSCDACRFWEVMEEGGLCMRNAPSPGVGVSQYASWPMTMADWRCGEFRVKGNA